MSLHISDWADSPKLRLIKLIQSANEQLLSEPGLEKELAILNAMTEDSLIIDSVQLVTDEIYNTGITVTSNIPDVTGSVECMVNRIDLDILSNYGSVEFKVNGKLSMHELLTDINERFSISLLPEEIENTPLPSDPIPAGITFEATVVAESNSICWFNGLKITLISDEDVIDPIVVKLSDIIPDPKLMGFAFKQIAEGGSVIQGLPEA